MAAAKSEPTLVTKAYHYGRPHYGYAAPATATGPLMRLLPPWPPRVVCRTHIRVVRTRYGLS